MKKQSSYYGDYKYGAFILGKPEQQFKTQSNFGIFNPVTAWEKIYDDASSQALKYTCKLFGNN